MKQYEIYSIVKKCLDEEERTYKYDYKEEKFIVTEEGYNCEWHIEIADDEIVINSYMPLKAKQSKISEIRSVLENINKMLPPEAGLYQLRQNGQLVYMNLFCFSGVDDLEEQFVYALGEAVVLCYGLLLYDKLKDHGSNAESIVKSNEMSAGIMEMINKKWLKTTNIHKRKSRLPLALGMGVLALGTVGLLVGLKE